MKKFKNFIRQYKSELIIALTAVSSITASIMTMEGSNAAICSIVIALVAILINTLKEGFSESTITLIAKAIQIIIEEVNKRPVEENDDNKVVAATAYFKASTPTLEEIKERLLEK